MQISVALGTNIISMACRHKDIPRYPWYMQQDIGAQPGTFPMNPHRRHMQNTFVNTTWSGTNPRRVFFHGASSKLSTNMDSTTYRHIQMVYLEPIMSVTQDS